MSAIVCIQKIITRYLKVDISDAHAEAMWKLTRANLYKRGLRRTIKDVKEALDGDLDSVEREHLMDSFALALTGKPWPVGADSDQDYYLFYEKAYAYLRSQGAIREDQDPMLQAIKVIIEVDGVGGSSIKVQKRKCGLYDVARKDEQAPGSDYVIKHPDCTADDAIRALGHYLTACASASTLARSSEQNS